MASDFNKLLKSQQIGINWEFHPLKDCFCFGFSAINLWEAYKMGFRILMVSFPNCISLIILNKLRESHVIET